MDQPLWIVPPASTSDATPSERAELEAQGFTAEQIAALSRLRDVYPVIEFVDSQEMQNLLFLKWLRRKWWRSREPEMLDEPPLAA